jgi:hypothetical protein
MAIAIDQGAELAAWINMGQRIDAPNFKGVDSGPGVTLLDIRGKNGVFNADEFPLIDIDVRTSNVNKLLEDTHRVLALFELPWQNVGNCGFVSPRGSFFAHLIFAVARHEGVNLITATPLKRAAIEGQARAIFDDFVLYHKIQVFLDFMNFKPSGGNPEALDEYSPGYPHPISSNVCTLNLLGEPRYTNIAQSIAESQKLTLGNPLNPMHWLLLYETGKRMWLKRYTTVNYSPIDQIRTGLDAGDDFAQQCPNSDIREWFLAWFNKEWPQEAKP